mmetsp:Transcript_17205/g.44819  ORF Transcript_17205/g.44819 Transcript_17205/m.44819 type:complete len:208 (+) Transcript_17205:350-973(+)
MSIWDKCSASLAAWRTRSTLSAAAANASVHWARRRSLLALAAATSAWYIWWISCWARSTARFRGPSSTVAAASHVCNAVARSSRSMSAVAGSSGRLRGDPSSARLRSSGPARLNRVGLSCSSPASRMRHDSFTFFTAFAFLLLTFAKNAFQPTAPSTSCGIGSGKSLSHIHSTRNLSTLSPIPLVSASEKEMSNTAPSAMTPPFGLT